MAAGASAHAVAGRRQAGRSRLRPVLRLAVSLDRQLPEAAGDQPRRAGRAARQDRAGDRPNLIKAMVAVEPSGPPVHDIENTGAPDWFKDAERTKVSGLADVPLAYDPPVPAGGALEFVREDKADKPDLVRCWLQKAPARQLPNLKRIPMVIIVSEASYHAPYDHCTSNYLTQAGVPNTLIRLADVGVLGNGHMMMIEKNNAAIADVIAQWLDRQRLRAAQAGR